MWLSIIYEVMELLRKLEHEVRVIYLLFCTFKQHITMCFFKETIGSFKKHTLLVGEISENRTSIVLEHLE